MPARQCGLGFCRKNKVDECLRVERCIKNDYEIRPGHSGGASIFFVEKVHYQEGCRPGDGTGDASGILREVR